ncbi:MAG TPA: GntR family transcriptional regulator [Planctomycetaceae bacterium]|jgi:GntR family transcriptional regulator|nr:GntR family transcriptional regulator [Planctomycetaceae bacterium]
MEFRLEASSRLPIYRQIVQQVREGVARGHLTFGEQLPSVRELSRILVVNPNTIARAYVELEREGILNNQPGRGVFVAEPRAQFAKEVRRRRLIELIDKFLTEAVHLGFSEADVLRLLAARSEQFQWEPGKLETGR